MTEFKANDLLSILASLGILSAAVFAGTLKVLAEIREIHLMVNSRLDELVAEVRKSSVSEGRDLQRAEHLLDATQSNKRG